MGNSLLVAGVINHKYIAVKRKISEKNSECELLKDFRKVVLGQNMMNNSAAHAHTRKVQRKYKNDLSKGRESDLPMANES